MRRPFLLLMFLAGPLALGACDWFEDLRPDNARVRITGESGAVVELVLSTQFVAGVTETGVTQVSVFDSDTLIAPLPVDTVVSITVDRQIFLQVRPFGLEQGQYRVRVDVDERNQLDESGDIFAENPFRYVYAFNQPTTRVIEVF